MNPTLVYESINDSTFRHIQGSTFNAKPIIFGMEQSCFRGELVTETVWSTITTTMVLPGQVEDFLHSVDFCPVFRNVHFRHKSTFSTVERLEVEKCPLVRFLLGSSFNRVRKQEQPANHRRRRSQNKICRERDFHFPTNKFQRTSKPYQVHREIILFAATWTGRPKAT